MPGNPPTKGDSPFFFRKGDCPLLSLYPIVNVREQSEAELQRTRTLAGRLGAAGVPLIQLRAKTLPAGTFAELATRLVEELAQHDTQLVVNDRIDVAMSAGAAGVHLGDEDLPVTVARELLGDDAIVGYSTHSEDEARAATTWPVDYLGFGPVFESPTKPGVRAARGVEALRRACTAATVPVVAIGGVTLETAPAAWAAGASAVAVISEIETAADVDALVEAYRAQAS